MSQTQTDLITPTYRIEVGEFARLTLILAGCGGTGSFAALHLARLAWVMQGKGLPVSLLFVDPDIVETKNIGRQNFCPAEVGQSKATTLAWRYGAAFGLHIQPVVDRVASLLGDKYRYAGYNDLTVIIGCVDTPAARREIQQMPFGARCWWLDSGNYRDGGQVLLGNWHNAECGIDPLGWCNMVPLPSVQEPGIVIDGEVEAEPVSCADLLVQESQSLMINQMMASWIGTYLSNLILSRNLDIMATYVSLAGSARSVSVTGERPRELTVQPEREPMERIEGMFTVEEMLEITGGTCPECGADVAIGRDTYDEEEVDITFCPACNWQLPVEELEMALLEAENA